MVGSSRATKQLRYFITCKSGINGLQMKEQDAKVLWNYRRACIVLKFSLDIKAKYLEYCLQTKKIAKFYFVIKNEQSSSQIS